MRDRRDGNMALGIWENSETWQGYAPLCLSWLKAVKNLESGWNLRGLCDFSGTFCCHAKKNSTCKYISQVPSRLFAWKIHLPVRILSGSIYTVISWKTAHFWWRLQMFLCILSQLHCRMHNKLWLPLRATVMINSSGMAVSRRSEDFVPCFD